MYIITDLLNMFCNLKVLNLPYDVYKMISIMTNRIDTRETYWRDLQERLTRETYWRDLWIADPE